MDARGGNGTRHSGSKREGRLYSRGFCREQGVKDMPSLLVNKNNKYLGLDIEEVDNQVLSKVVSKPDL